VETASGSTAPFMAWITDGSEKTMGDVVDEWCRRNSN
jgi:hypothetical protein